MEERKMNQHLSEEEDETEEPGQGIRTHLFSKTRLRKESQSIHIVAGKIRLRGDNGDSKRRTSEVRQEMFLFNTEELSGKLHNSSLTHSSLHGSSP